MTDPTETTMTTSPVMPENPYGPNPTAQSTWIAKYLRQFTGEPENTGIPSMLTIVADDFTGAMRKLLDSEIGLSIAGKIVDALVIQVLAMQPQNPLAIV